jgi:uncharacterized protein (UPF0332 family)
VRRKSKLARVFGRAKNLTAYAITARYPGTVEVTRDEAVNAIEIADQVRQTIRKALEDEGFSQKPITN